jgi:ATP-dependent Clp protease protease subunit
MLKNTLALAAALTLAVHADPTTKPAPENPAPAQPAKKQPAKAQTAVPVEPKAADKAENPAAKVAEKPAEPKKESPADSELEKAKAAQERLAIFNALATEEQKHDTLDLRSDIALLKLEKELLVETLALAAAQKNSKQADAIAKFESEKERLTREVTLAKLRSEHLSSQLKELQATSSLKTSALMAQISEIETSNKREDYVDAEPQYLDNPLKKDGTLVISDRRIPFNGPVTSNLADKVTERINYFNNKDPKKPIFIVIDDSPGGSVMAGYRILKSMEGSEAPVYVVVKSFAASMAATITTLAEKSFVYPNAVILHHQISQSFMFSSMNLTEQKENVDDLMRWWNRLAGPIAEKMGITPDEFIEMMYKKTVSGDWSEFGDDAVKLKWADHAVTRIHETALLKNPDAKKVAVATTTRASESNNGLTPAIDDQGNPYMILPRRNPKDAYLMHNPDGYYRFK